MLAIVSVGLNPSSSSSNSSINAVKETLCIYDGISGAKLSSHRMEGPITSGLTFHESRGIFTTRQNKATMSTFAIGKELPSLRFAAPEALGPIQFSSDAVHLVAGGVSGTVYVWEVESGQMLVAFKAHYRKVTALQFSEDDALLVTGGEDAMVHFYDFSSLLTNASAKTCLLRTVSTFKTSISSVSVFGMGGINSLIAVGSMDHTLVVHHGVFGKEMFSGTFSSPIVSVDVNMNGVVAGMGNGHIYVIKSFVETCSCLGHDKAVTSVQWILSGLQFISGSEDGTMRWWDAASCTQIRMVKMEGQLPIQSVRVASALFETMSTTHKPTVVPLKKVKESEQEDRFVSLLDDEEEEEETPSWEVEEDQENVNGSTTQSSSSVSTTTSLDNERWKRVAYSLYSVAVDRVTTPL